LSTANVYERHSSKYIHKYIISINIMVITNIEMTTQYIPDKTSHIHTHRAAKRIVGPQGKRKLGPLLQFSN
jgi:hypothetical protein